MKEELHPQPIFNCSQSWRTQFFLCLIICIGHTMYAQPVFGDPQPNPFGLYAPSGGDTLSQIRLVDIDHDGVLEAFIYSGTNDPPYYSWQGLKYFENTGSNKAPQFEFVGDYPFGIPSNTTNWLWQFADINGDGLEDFVTFSFSYNNPVSVIFNTGNSEIPDFSGSIISNPYGIALPVSSVDGSKWDGVAPTFVDIDADGDLDLFYGGLFINDYADDGFYFSENTGTATTPQYALPVKNPFGLIFPLSKGLHWDGFGDVDCDGDLDIYILRTPPTTRHFFENIGSDTMPKFDIPKVIPTGLTPPVGDFIDVGGDGDPDLIGGADGPGIAFYEHLGCPPLKVREGAVDINVKLAPNPVQEMLRLRLRSKTTLRNTSLEIFDLMGKRVFTSKPETSGTVFSQKIDVSQLLPGVYFLKITVGNRSVVRKFVRSD